MHSMNSEPEASKTHTRGAENCSEGNKDILKTNPISLGERAAQNSIHNSNNSNSSNVSVSTNDAAKPLGTGSKRHKYYATPTRSLGSHQQSSSQSFQSPPTTIQFVESSFVTPGIFRRKVSRRKQSIHKAGDKENNEQFQWSIDQISKMKPMEFDESELSLPPEDWDPSAEFSRSQASAIEQFWTRHTHIAPSPDVLATSVAADVKSPEIPPARANPSFGSGPSNSSQCSSSIMSLSMMSPMMLLSRSQMFESTRANNIGEKSSSIDPKLLIADGSDDFEQLERSFSFEVADSIVADMDDGAFVLKNETGGTSHDHHPIERSEFGNLFVEEQDY